MLTPTSIFWILPGAHLSHLPRPLLSCSPVSFPPRSERRKVPPLLIKSRLTVFIVAIVDWAKPGGEALSAAAIIGGLLIIAAFLLLSWSTYREMNKERKKRYVSHPLRHEMCSPCLTTLSRLEDEAIISDSDAES